MDLIKKTAIKFKYAFIFGLFTLFWLGISLKTKAFFSGFHLTDDYLIFYIKKGIEQNGIVHSLINGVTWELPTRLKPMYNICKVIKTYLFGTNYSLWASFTLLSAGLCSTLLYAFAQKLNFSKIESALFPIFSLLGYQSIIWFHLSYDEMQAMVWVAFSLLFLALEINCKKHKKLYNYLFLFFAALASLSKETFILMITAFVFLQNYLYKEKNNIGWIQTIKTNNVTNLFLLALLTFEIIYLKFFIHATSIGYAGIGGVNISAYSSSIYDFYSLTGLIPLISALVMLFCIFDKNRKNLVFNFLKTNINPLIFSLLVIVPQCIAYTKSGFFPRYLLPAMLGMSFFTINVLRFFRLNIQSQVKNILIYSLIFVTSLSLFSRAYSITSGYAAEGLSTQKVLNILNADKDKTEKIVVVGDINVNYEQTQAFAKYLSLLQNKENIYYYPLLMQKEGLDEFQKSLIKTFLSDNKDVITTSVSDKYDTYIVFASIRDLFASQNQFKLNNYIGYDCGNFLVIKKKRDVK